MKRGISQVLLQPDSLFCKYSAGFQLVEKIREIRRKAGSNALGGRIGQQGTRDGNEAFTGVLQLLWEESLEQILTELRALGVFVLFEYANRWVLP